MPQGHVFADPSLLSVQRLKEELSKNGVRFDSGKRPKKYYVDLYKRNVTATSSQLATVDFSSDDDYRPLRTSPARVKTNRQSFPGRGVVSSGSSLLPSDVDNLPDDSLRTELIRLGEQPGPITDTSRQLYQRKLREILRTGSRGHSMTSGSPPHRSVLSPQRRFEMSDEDEEEPGEEDEEVDFVDEEEEQPQNRQDKWPSSSPGRKTWQTRFDAARPSHQEDAEKYHRLPTSAQRVSLNPYKEDQPKVVRRASPSRRQQADAGFAVPSSTVHSHGTASFNNLASWFQLVAVALFALLVVVLFVYIEEPYAKQIPYLTKPSHLQGSE